jgi:hypothetical protein
MLKKKIWAEFQRIFELCSQKYVFGIRDLEKTYFGSRIQGSKKHRIPDPDPGPGSATLFFLLFLLDYLRIWIRIRTLVLLDPDPEGPKPYGSYGSGSATLLSTTENL